MPRPTQSKFDVIIIGAGIHGIMTALLAAERGYRPVLLDKSNPGCATSNEWYGILHGGLRYLQSLDVSRYRTAVQDRRWFMENAPDAIKLQPFLMPLYGKGLKRGSIFRMAFWLDRILSMDRNRNLPADLRLGAGKVLTSQSVLDVFPSVPERELKDGALWQEAVVPDLSALFAVMVAKAQAANIPIVSQCEVNALLVENETVIGVRCKANQSEIHAPFVINCAGPWGEHLASHLDPTYQKKTGLSLAFNLVVNRPAPSTYGVAITPPDRNQDMLFLYPEGDNKTRLGTWYEDLSGSLDNATPTDQAIANFIKAVNQSLPKFSLSESDISAITKGVLPTQSLQSKELLNKPCVIDHAKHGGPKGFFTLIGIKYTTARSTARLALDCLRSEGKN